MINPTHIEVAPDIFLTEEEHRGNLAYDAMKDDLTQQELADMKLLGSDNVY